MIYLYAIIIVIAFVVSRMINVICVEYENKSNHMRHPILEDYRTELLTGFLSSLVWPFVVACIIVFVFVDYTSVWWKMLSNYFTDTLDPLLYKGINRLINLFR